MCEICKITHQKQLNQAQWRIKKIKTILRRESEHDNKWQCFKGCDHILDEHKQTCFQFNPLTLRIIQKYGRKAIDQRYRDQQLKDRGQPPKKDHWPFEIQRWNR